MSQYDPIVPTIRGRAMLTQALKEGKALLFTKAEWGDGVKQDNQQSELFTGLIHKVIESGFTNREQDGDTLYLTTVYDNSKLTTGFYVRELGIYARVGADGQEYLFAYTYAPVASYTPPSSQYNEKRLKIAIGIDKDATVAIKFNSQQYVTREELDIHNKDAAAHVAAFLIHNKDTNAHKVLFDKFVKDVKIKSKAENSFTVTKGDNSTTTVTINNVEHASNADEATKANYLVTNENGCIYHDLSKVAAGADISVHVNWSAKDNTRKIKRYIFHDAKGEGELADIQAKTVYANLSGNADTSNRLVSERAGVRPVSANIATSGDASIRYFLATDSMKYGAPSTNGAILQLGWDYSNNYDSQLFIPNNVTGRVQWRAQSGNADWQSPNQWKSLAWQDDLNNYLPLTGGTITGGMTFNGDLDVQGNLSVITQTLEDYGVNAANTKWVQDFVKNYVGSSGAVRASYGETGFRVFNDGFCIQWGVFPFSDGTMYVDVSLPITATVLAVAAVDYYFNSSAKRIDLPRCVSIEGYSLQSKTRLRALSAYDGVGHVQYIALTKID